MTSTKTVAFVFLHVREKHSKMLKSIKLNKIYFKKYVEGVNYDLRGKFNAPLNFVMLQRIVNYPTNCKISRAV